MPPGMSIAPATFMKTVAQKMGIKADSRAYLRDAPAEAVEAMQLPTLALSRLLTGQFDYIHLFVTTQAGFEQQFERLASHLAAKGMLWVSWPKGGQLDTDLSLPTVIKLGYDRALVESICLSIDKTWSALKFTHPINGKVYRNSYGKLKAPHS